MGNVHLVTGYAGQDHVTSADHGSMNAALMGGGNYVMNKGNQLSASVISNQVRVLDGDILMQGRYIRLNQGTYVDIPFEAGSASFKRKDLLVCRYTKDSATGVESANLQIIKGTPDADSADDPSYNEGNILDGSCIISDFPLYRLSFDGLDVTVEQVFTICKSLADVVADMEQINKMNPDALLKAGGTMRGALLLSTSEPEADREAASKGYVDTHVQAYVDEVVGSIASTLDSINGEVV